MKPRSFFASVISACLLLLSGALSAAEFDSRMKLRADAPGGAFTDREALTFRLVNNTPRPKTYTVENWKGEIVAQGEWPAGDAPLTLKALPHGHYLLKTAPGACAFAVLPDPAARRVPADAPFHLDTHISWTGGDNASAGYPGEAGYRFIAELGRRAGVGFLRDRISWGPVNPARGEFRFDGSWNRSAAAVHAAGLRMLSVYHDAPAWTKDDPKKRMPTDLFAVYEFNRRLARHFRGKIDFWEFWNEQDIGFSDAAAWDYAAAMKAAYLGFKAGNPDITVLTGPFCVDTPAGFCRAALKSDLPQYFDVFSYHTYASPDNFPKLLEQIRQVLKESGAPASMPVWFSETGTRAEGPAEAPGLRPGLKEHSFRQELAVAREVPKVLASLQRLGVARAFWFNLMPVNEWNGSKAWGMLRRDYTIKAQYTAFATLTAQLGEAKIEGGLKLPGVRALLYRRADGTQSLLAWSESGAKELRIPGKTARTEAVDLFGTPLEISGGKLVLDENPVYLHGLAGLSPAVPAIPAGTPGAAPTADDKTVVLRAILPDGVAPGSGRDSLDLPEKPVRITLEICNFDTVAKTGTVTVAGDGTAEPSDPVTVPAMGRAAVALTVTPKIADGGCRGELVFGGTFNGRPASRLVIPLFLAGRVGDFCRDVPMPAMLEPGSWSHHSSGSMTVAAVPEEKAVKFTVEFPDGVDRWAFPAYKLQLPQESLAGAAGIAFEIRRLTPGRIVFSRVNARWDGRFTGEGFEPPETEWQERRVLFHSGFEPERIKELEIGFNPAEKSFGWMIRNIRVFYTR